MKKRGLMSSIVMENHIKSFIIHDICSINIIELFFNHLINKSANSHFILVCKIDLSIFSKNLYLSFLYGKLMISIFCLN